jgi:hypothetical protein
MMAMKRYKFIFLLLLLFIFIPALSWVFAKAYSTLGVQT